MLFMKGRAHLDGKVRLIRQLTGVAVRRKLARHVQAVLDEVSAELIVQGLLSAYIA